MKCECCSLGFLVNNVVTRRTHWGSQQLDSWAFLLTVEWGEGSGGEGGGDEGGGGEGGSGEGGESEGGGGECGGSAGGKNEGDRGDSG